MNENDSGEINIGGQYYSVSEVREFKTILIRIDPYTPEKRSVNFEGIEELQELTSLTIRGDNFDTVDFSPLKALKNLKHIDIGMNTTTGFTKIPDLSGLDSLGYLTIQNATLSSVDNIEKIPHLRELRLWHIHSHPASVINMSALGQLTEIEFVYIVGDGNISFTNWNGPPGLEKLEMEIGERFFVDCTGIEVLKGLKFFDMKGCTPVHIEELAKLKNIETLEINIKNPNQSFDFLSTMTSLRTLHLYGDYNNPEMLFADEEKHNYIRIDISPLRGLKNIDDLVLQGFTIENFQTVDELPLISWVDVYNSRFYPENSKWLRRDIIIVDELSSDR
jgi:Leucine-rich repeat (LRR) protein